MKYLVAVIIPIYKEEISKNELNSLTQGIKILKSHPIIFIAPQGLNTDSYQEVCGTEIAFQIKYFDDGFFKDITGYNKLMLSEHFYKTFLMFKFILIYQLDAFVFKDELLYWCKQNYDFIGAPHSPHLNLPGMAQYYNKYEKVLAFFNHLFNANLKISNVGNGGFSLRKTRSCYWLLKLLGKQVKRWGNNNEDGFFKYWGNILFPFFKLPPDEIALKFSIETEPEKSLKALNYKLPFGCHAFEKYDYQIWKPYIDPINL